MRAQEQYVEGCTGKQGYWEKADVRRAAKASFKRTNHLLYYYVCDNCGAYHLTGRPQHKGRNNSVATK